MFSSEGLLRLGLCRGMTGLRLVATWNKTEPSPRDADVSILASSSPGLDHGCAPDDRFPVDARHGWRRGNRSESHAGRTHATRRRSGADVQADQGGAGTRAYRPAACRSGAIAFGLGVPLAAESHVAAFYPPNWLFYRLWDVATAYRLTMWLHCWPWRRRPLPMREGWGSAARVRSGRGEFYLVRLSGGARSS